MKPYRFVMAFAGLALVVAGASVLVSDSAANSLQVAGACTWQSYGNVTGCVYNLKDDCSGAGDTPATCNNRKVDNGNACQTVDVPNLQSGGSQKTQDNDCPGSTVVQSCTCTNEAFGLCWSCDETGAPDNKPCKDLVGPVVTLTSDGC